MTAEPWTSRTARGPTRIVSMLASGTEIAVALGLEDRLVGISHECDWPDRVLDRQRLSRPRFDPEGLSSGEIDRAVRHAMIEFGSVYEVDADALEALRPGLILTQAVCEVCAVPTPGVEALVAARGIDAQVLSLDAHTLEDILQCILQVGAATGEKQSADRLVADCRARIDRVVERTAGLERRRVLAIEWLEPPFAPGHWVPEMVTAAGGINLIGEAGAHSMQAGWNDLAGLDPDVLIVMPCGYGLEASATDANRFARELREIAGRSIDRGRAWVVDGSAYFNRSGPRTIDGIEIMASIIHPETLGEPPATAAVRWRDMKDE